MGIVKNRQFAIDDPVLRAVVDLAAQRESGKLLACCPALDPAITVASIEAGSAPAEAVSDGLVIYYESFDRDIHICQRVAAVYEMLLLDRNRRIITEKNFSDCGREIEFTVYFVYYHEGVPAGAAGLYRYVDRPAEFWVGRIGAADEVRKAGIGAAIIGHLRAEALVRGGTILKCYCHDGESFTRLHRFYERCGFTLTDETYFDEDQIQRVYSLPLISEG